MSKLNKKIIHYMKYYTLKSFLLACVQNKKLNTSLRCTKVRLKSKKWKEKQFNEVPKEIQDKIH
jgi:hypothetical protein